MVGRWIFFGDILFSGAILVSYISLGIKSPSENGNGTQILCWGGDYTPQSSAENMTGCLGFINVCHFHEWGCVFLFELVEQAANLWMPSWVNSLRLAVEALGTIHSWRFVFRFPGENVWFNLGNDDGFAGSTTRTNRYMGKSTLKIDRY